MLNRGLLFIGVQWIEKSVHETGGLINLEGSRIKKKYTNLIAVEIICGGLVGCLWGDVEVAGEIEFSNHSIVFNFVSNYPRRLLKLKNSWRVLVRKG